MSFGGAPENLVAEQGDADAQYNLGWCYANGEGVEKDFTQAVAWWHKAAEQGHAVAQYNMGVCYYKEKENFQAVYWWRKAARQGNEMAQQALRNIGETW